MPNVNNAYTRTESPNKLLTFARAILMILRHLLKWACEELNLGPHAYQALRSKASKLQLRKLVELTSGRRWAHRTKKPVELSQPRRQRVGKRPSADDPSRSFWTFNRLSSSERRLRRAAKVARSIPTRQLTDRELVAIALHMRLEGGR